MASPFWSNVLQRRLEADGWVKIPDVCSDLLPDILATIGIPIVLEDGSTVHTVAPKPSHMARKKSLSGNFGFGAFPAHTDLAYWPNPPHYMVLHSSRTSTTPTFILDSHDLPKDRAQEWERAVWQVSDAAKPFLCSMFFRRENRTCIRWDQCAMQPLGNHAPLVKSDICEALSSIQKNSVTICWDAPNTLIVIDNWRCLHARGSVSDSDKGRVLNRAYTN